jgi:hypothetical protein
MPIAAIALAMQPSSKTGLHMQFSMRSLRFEVPASTLLKPAQKRRLAIELGGVSAELRFLLFPALEA